MLCFSCHGHWSHSVGQELSDKPMGRLRPKGVPFAGSMHTSSDLWLGGGGEHVGRTAEL